LKNTNSIGLFCALSRDYPPFFVSDEGNAAKLLIDAILKSDPDLLTTALKNHTFNFIDNEVARVIKSIKVVGSAKGKEAVEEEENSLL
jgi:hypothetical protein